MTHPTVSAPATSRPGEVSPRAGEVPLEAGEVSLQMRRDGYELSPELARLREECPLAPTRVVGGVLPAEAWLVTRYEDVREVLGDHRRFSNRADEFWDRAAERAGLSRDMPVALAGMLLGLDPPEHTRLRRMLTGQFTVKRMARLRPRVQEIVADRIAEMRRAHDAGGPVDLVEAFAHPVPSLVICELLGVPYADRAEFQRFSTVQIDMRRPFPERMAAMADSYAYMARLVAEHRRSPGDDLVGLMVREHGDDITDDELVGVAALLLVAGHETTANMLALGTLLLLQHPRQLAALRDGTVPAENAVEELLRYLTIVHTGLIRVATADVTVAGRPVRAGEGLVCSLPLANRDPVLGERLDELDLGRTPPPHIAFGHGVHHCLGAPLARMELEVALPALLRAFPALRLAVPPEELEFRSVSMVHGVTSVPVTW